MDQSQHPGEGVGGGGRGRGALWSECGSHFGESSRFLSLSFPLHVSWTANNAFSIIFSEKKKKTHGRELFKCIGLNRKALNTFNLF